MNGQSPVFIAGTNGSGTRIYAQLFEMAGVYQGSDMNYAFEPFDIIPTTRPLVPKLMKSTSAATYEVESVPKRLRGKIENGLNGLAEKLRADRPEEFQYWGWKHPRNLYLAPLLLSLFPDCFFVQVLRDGRDMAFARNKADTRAFSRFLLDVKDPQPAQCTHFWSKVNCEVAQWCEQHFDKRFVWSRFEDLCARPDVELQRIVDALGLDCRKVSADQCATVVDVPGSLGRWRAAPQELQDALHDVGTEGLARFGYV